MPVPFTQITKEVEGIEWLWKDWIPKSQLTCVVAEPGCGKSAFVLWLAACVAGRLPIGSVEQWPDGQPFSHQFQPVIWCEAEARWAGHVTRAKDLHLQFEAGQPERLHSVVPTKETFMLSNQADMKTLFKAAEELKPGLIVLDSLGASHTKSENDAAMQQLLVPLQVLADRVKAAVLMIHHVNKPNGQNPQTRLTWERIRGSSAITHSVVSAIAMDKPDKNDKNHRRVYSIKSNFGGEPAEFGFRWVSRELEDGSKDSHFVFGAAPGEVEAGNAATLSQRAKATAALQVILTADWQPASKCIDLVNRRFPGLKSANIEAACAKLRTDGIAEQAFQRIGEAVAPVSVWRLLDKSAKPE